MATSARKRASGAKTTKRATAKTAAGKAGAKGAARKSAKGAARKTTARGSQGGGARKSAGVRKSSGGRAARANAITMLKDDHDRVEEMIDRFERARSDDQKQQLAEKICAELTLHAQIEEEVFYPAVRKAIRDDDLMDEAEVEHATAKLLIADIERGKMGDPQWEAKVTVLGEYVKHHVKEEENEMFPKARKAGVDLEALGEAIAARKARGTAGGGGEQGSDQRGPDGRGERRGQTEDEAERQEGGSSLIDTVRSMLPGG